MSDQLDMNAEERAKRQKRNNGVVVAMCVTVFFSMVGATFAAVPLYRLFCQVTGYGGTVREASSATGPILDKTITVRFDSNISGGLPWEFKPDQREVTMKIGETKQIFYHAKNLADVETTGQATFNVAPDQAGAYFNKIQCFCFTEQTLKPGEEAEMPVVFFVDPDIVKDAEAKGIRTITLSYTMYPHEKTRPVASAKKPSTTEKQL